MKILPSNISYYTDLVYFYEDNIWGLLPRNLGSQTNLEKKFLTENRVKRNATTILTVLQYFVIQVVTLNVHSDRGENCDVSG
jgi:hypothetical protein